MPVNQPNSQEWDFWAFWQYTSNAQVNGIAGRVDADLFNGDETAYKKYGPAGDVAGPAPVPTPTPVPDVPTPGPTYTVTPRDYDGLAAALSRIGISDWKAVADLNGLKAPYVIKAGQVLRLTAGATTPTGGWDGIYTVTDRDSDGLAAALARVGVGNWKAVADHNGLQAPYVIHAGDRLAIPGGQIASERQASTYTVQSRDSDGLAAAMSRIGVSDWHRIADLNGLKDPYIIHVGDVLRLV